MARMPLVDRLEALRVVAPTPALGTTTLQSPDEPIPAAIFNATTMLDNTHNVALALENSGHSSPDEIVIRQRGRRRLTTNWSPDKTPISNPFQRTPTKMPLLSSSMILRSSPRKRLTMGSTPPDTSANSHMLSPTKLNTKHQIWSCTSPIVKKLRTGNEERPLAQSNDDVALDAVLQGMTKEQLIAIIVQQVGTPNDAIAEKQLRSHLPLPDILALESELIHAKKNIFKSLPTSRLCKKTDSSAYSRAAVHLAEFKRILSDHTKQLHDSCNWDALLDYVAVAWPCVRATPLWDANHHNAVRRQCFKLLSCHSAAAVRNGGLRLGLNRLIVLEQSLADWAKDCEDVLSCVNALNKTLTKSRCSL